MDLKELKPRRNQAVPIYLQLYRRYREAIAAGKLSAGDRVPSVRSLASELNLARGTVELAYQMLTSEGYLLARGPAGTVVSPQLGSLGEPLLHAPARKSSSKAQSRPRVATAEPGALQLGLPALDAFPRKTWARLAGRSLRTLDIAAMTAPDPCGYEPLRRAIATYLGISRGIACTHEQVFITAGYRGAQELVCRTLLKTGDAGWFEDPGYVFARQFLEHMGMRLIPVPVDGEGLNVSIGLQRADDARFAVVTPTHQSPLGVALSLPRRLQLLEWANRRQTWIVEDDYDSEFRYHGRPLPALKSLDRSGRVLYAGTFSKVLFPGLRLAYLVVPEQQLDRFRETANQLPGPGSILPQATVSDFMEQGHFARHLRKMRSLYAARRGYLTDALAQVFGSQFHVPLQAGGIHVVAFLNTRQSDKALVAAANAHGFAVEALSNSRMQRTSRGGLLMGFTNLATSRQALASVQQLKTVLAQR